MVEINFDISNNECYGEIYWKALHVRDEEEIYIYPFCIAKKFKEVPKIIEKLEYTTLHELIHLYTGNNDEIKVHALSLLLCSANEKTLDLCSTWEDAFRLFIRLENEKINIIEID